MALSPNACRGRARPELTGPSCYRVLAWTNYTARKFGWGVIDFWKSREQFDRFAAERIGPAMAAIGAAGPAPDVHEFPVHEHFPR
jgi:hypothetical protein